MMAAIAAQYALPITPATAARFAGAAALAAGGLSVVGRGVANLAKLIPGLGTGAGGAINAGIASTLTIGVGRAWMAVYEHLNDKSLEEIETILAPGDDMQHIFLAAFKARAKPGWDHGRRLRRLRRQRAVTRAVCRRIPMGTTQGTRTGET